LLTEHNPEIGFIYSEDEVIYYNEPDEAVGKIQDYLGNPEKLDAVTRNGYRKVTEGGYSYREILKKVLKQIDE